MTETREMTMADVLGYVGRHLADRRAAREAAAAGAPAPGGRGCGSGGACGSGPGGSGSCGCSGGTAPAPAADALPTSTGRGASACGCGGGGACGEGGAAAAVGAAREPPGGPPPRPEELPDANTIMDKPVDRRRALGMMVGGVAAGAGLASACSPTSLASAEKREAKLLEWEEYFKGNFRLMTDREKAETVERLERLAELRQGVDVSIGTEAARPGVVYGYAFNISKCKGYRNCVSACINENNLDRETGTQYIRIFEMEDGEEFGDLGHGDATYEHAVPAESHFYVGTQCFQCANPPCVEVCPVNATWQEPDGITVVDYDWCIGCRYCMAACPYWARRFNWSDPVVPADEVNRDQHYLGNRARKKGVVEKCTFCIQRSRRGELPACVEACPTGARVFGNLLDPDSEIRWVLENKRVFRLKEELGTEPRFWYFMD